MIDPQELHPVEADDTRPMTKGEFRVGIKFNPSKDDGVGQIKRAAADFIDQIGRIPDYPPNTENMNGDFKNTLVEERMRLKALAQQCVETAAMHAVKAATKTP